MLASAGITVLADEETDAAAAETAAEGAAEGEAGAAEDSSGGGGASSGIITDAADFDTDIDYRDEATVIKLMKPVAETDALILYYSEKSTGAYGPLICLTDKKTGTNWFSSPINVAKDQSELDENGNIIAQYDSPKSVQLNQLKSLLEMSYGDVSAKASKNTNNFKNADVLTEEIANGIKLTFTFEVVEAQSEEDTPENIVVPVSFTLEEDYMKVSVLTNEIVEQDATRILTVMSILKYLGAAGINDVGYFVIPDGSGALVEFNNGKGVSPAYKGVIYGRDITKVETTATANVKNVEFPMYGIVKNNSGLMAVITKGDGQASVNALVSGQSNKVFYNTAYFELTARSEDLYAISGETDMAKNVRMFELYGIKVPEFEFRYYPVSGDDGKTDYVDIANKYHDYLVKEKGITPTATASETPLYVDLYGGVLKQRSVLGVPVEMQTAITTFDDAKRILENLKAAGVGDMVVTYENYTADSIRREVSTSGAPASKLGGNGDFKKLLEYASGAGIDLYPGVSNIRFNSGNGYTTMFDTTVRITGTFSRQPVYDLAHKIENQFYDPEALLSPLAYGRMFNQLTKNYTKRGYTGIALGENANTLYGDYGRDFAGRETAKSYIVEGYAGLKNAGISIIGSAAHEYVIPYVDHITNIPLESSGFDMFDADIPFYQIVMSGLRPVATTGVNGEARLSDALLKAVACGSNLKVDMIGSQAEMVKDTRLDNLFYANADNWTSSAAAVWKFQSAVLGDTAGQMIVGYETNGDVITTTFANGTVLVTNLSDKTVSKNGQIYNLYDYIGKEIIG
jgi:hypothetical protein